MTHPQISRAARRARRQEQLRGTARARPAEDPELRRMLATHMHCGEPMQLVGGDPVLPNDGFEMKNDGGRRTYRCTCGFSFDQAHT